MTKEEIILMIRKNRTALNTAYIRSYSQEDRKYVRARIDALDELLADIDDAEAREKGGIGDV